MIFVWVPSIWLWSAGDGLDSMTLFRPADFVEQFFICRVSSSDFRLYIFCKDIFFGCEFFSLDTFFSSSNIFVSTFFRPNNFSSGHFFRRSNFSSAQFFVQTIFRPGLFSFQQFFVQTIKKIAVDISRLHYFVWTSFSMVFVHSFISFISLRSPFSMHAF